LEHLSLKSPLQATMAVALGVTPVWYPWTAKLGLMPPQVAPLAVALGLVPIHRLHCHWPFQKTL